VTVLGGTVAVSKSYVWFWFLVHESHKAENVGIHHVVIPSF
jgi:hypothetical protein